MRITVLMGGTSSERDVSLASGVRIADALRTRGHEVVAVDTARGALSAADEAALKRQVIVKAEPPTLDSLRQLAGTSLSPALGMLPQLADCDVAFLALHGGQGEDGTVQALLDMAGVRYTGSGHLASALAMDKDLSKRLFRNAGVGTADWLMAPADRPKSFPRSAARELGLPLIVKPSKQGSTVGLSLVRDVKTLDAAIDEARQYDDEVMLEAFVAGRELTVGVLGDEALPVGEIIPKHEIYDYECKYTAGMAVEEFPAKLTKTQTKRAQQQALSAFEALKLRGYARIDFRMTKAGEFFCLEANTLPGMTATSLIPQAAVARGMSFPELCERIAELALVEAHTDNGGGTG